MVADQTQRLYESEPGMHGGSGPLRSLALSTKVLAGRSFGTPQAGCSHHRQ